MPLGNQTYIIIIALLGIAAITLVLVSLARARKWRRRYEDEREEFASYSDGVDTELNAVRARAAELEHHYAVLQQEHSDTLAYLAQIKAKVPATVQPADAIPQEPVTAEPVGQPLATEPTAPAFVRETPADAPDALPIASLEATLAAISPAPVSRMTPLRAPDPEDLPSNNTTESAELTIDDHSAAEPGQEEDVTLPATDTETVADATVPTMAAAVIGEPASDDAVDNAIATGAPALHEPDTAPPATETAAAADQAAPIQTTPVEEEHVPAPANGVPEIDAGDPDFVAGDFAPVDAASLAVESIPEATEIEDVANADAAPITLHPEEMKALASDEISNDAHIVTAAPQALAALPGQSSPAEPAENSHVASDDTATEPTIDPAPTADPAKSWFGSGRRDDLLRIRGIDALLSARLFALGVTTYDDIDQLSQEDEMALEQRLSVPAGYIIREQWRAQASLLCAGKEDEFNERFAGQHA